jgi:3-hydroxyacyl-[acyl-carrier-protein] dehydratase
MRLEYFRLIDRILELDHPGRRIRAEASVPKSSPVFEGHFPGHPLLPGVLLLETMAQASGWLIIGTAGFTHMPFLAGVKELKLRSFVVPGQTLIVDAHIEHDGSGFTVTRAEVGVDGKRVCNAEIMLRLIEFANPQFRGAMQEVAAAIGLPIETAADG